MMVDQVDEQGLPVWPAAERNKQPILEQLRSVLPTRSQRLLEIAAGTGQHALFFAQQLPWLEYTPTDYDSEHLATLRERVRASALPNLNAPLHLDVCEVEWPLGCVDVIYNANMVHIAPWEVAVGLFRGAKTVLKRGGLLVTYGPYRLDGEHTSPSNERFDQSLRSRDARWGVRDLSELALLAHENGLVLRERRAMPANNFFVVWDRV